MLNYAIRQLHEKNNKKKQGAINTDYSENNKIVKLWIIRNANTL